MKVYTLVRGNWYEDSSIQGVFSSLELARQAVKKNEPCWGPWEETVPNYWVSRSDFLEIELWELDE